MAGWRWPLATAALSERAILAEPRPCWNGSQRRGEAAQVERGCAALAAQQFVAFDAVTPAHAAFPSPSVTQACQGKAGLTNDESTPHLTLTRHPTHRVCSPCGNSGGGRRRARVLLAPLGAAPRAAPARRGVPKADGARRGRLALRRWPVALLLQPSTRRAPRDGRAAQITRCRAQAGALRGARGRGCAPFLPWFWRQPRLASPLRAPRRVAAPLGAVSPALDRSGTS